MQIHAIVERVVLLANGGGHILVKFIGTNVNLELLQLHKTKSGMRKMPSIQFFQPCGNTVSHLQYQVVERLTS